MTLSIIVAVAENNVIGKDNRLIWRMPADMQYFKEKTTGHCVITGRKNYESIPGKFRPLPGRTNIVVTRQENYSAPGAMAVNTIEEAVALARAKGETECFVIGGADIYRQTLESSDKIYLTVIHYNFEGDAFFPELDRTKWNEISRQDHPADEKHKYAYSFMELVRR